MLPAAVPLSKSATTRTSLEKVTVGMLCVAAVAGPLAFGATGPWARFVLEATLAVAASLWALSRTRNGRSLLLPLAIASLFLLQLVPLPDGSLVSLAPVSAGRWKVAREGLEAGWATISVDPGVTLTAIRRLLLGLATIAAVTSLARTPTYRRWLYTALATSGLLVLAAAFVFPVNPANRAVMGVFSLRGAIEFWKSPERAPLQTSGAGYLDWVTVGEERYLIDAPVSGDGFGTYIYSNHFANALCLTLPALWALWMMLSSRKGLPAALRFAVLVGLMALAAWTTGWLAHSRAGTAALAFSAVVYIALVARSRWLQWLAGGVAAATAVGLLVFVATFQGPFPGLLELLPDAMHAKIAGLLVDTRIVAAKVAGRMFLASPVLGTGLGTYGDLYPALQRSEHTLFFAHNDYAQLLAESGLLGCGLLGAAAWLFGSRLWRFCRERPPTKRVIDAGAWAALAGAAAHGVFDWNMHAPANAFLACVVAGLALSSVTPAGQPQQSRWAGSFGFTAALALAVACLAVVPLLARDAFSADARDALRRSINAARLAALKPDAPPATPVLEAAIARGERAARLDPGDAHLPVLLGQANLHLAAVTQDTESRHALRQRADEWFRTARRASAVTRGFPEPLPRPTK